MFSEALALSLTPPLRPIRYGRLYQGFMPQAKKKKGLLPGLWEYSNPSTTSGDKSEAMVFNREILEFPLHVGVLYLKLRS